MRIVLRTAEGFEAKIYILRNREVRVRYNGGASVDLGKWTKLNNEIEVLLSEKELLEALYESGPERYVDLVKEPLELGDNLIFELSSTAGSND